VDVELAIDSRSGDFARRVAILHAQTSPLITQRFKITLDGIRLDNDLRAHKIVDFESIGILEVKVTRLEEKRRSAIEEEEIIEQRRQRFASVLTLAHAFCGSVDSKIASLAFAPLMKAREEQYSIRDTRNSIIEHNKAVSGAWADLTAMRSFSAVDLDEFQYRIPGLLDRCDATL
jgi:hypothetical protein